MRTVTLVPRGVRCGQVCPAARQFGYQRRLETRSREMRPRAVVRSPQGNHLIGKAGKVLGGFPYTHSV